MIKKALSYLVCATISVFTLISCAGNSSSSDKSNEGEKVENEEQPAVNAEDAVYNGNPYETDRFKVEDNVLISDNLPIVVDFYADWCGPCKKYAPVFHAVAAQYEGQAIFVSIDTEAYPDIANRYGIKSIPSTTFIYPDGGVLGTNTGAMDEEELSLYVNQLLANTEGNSLAI